jgi:hypothetical protein
MKSETRFLQQISSRIQIQAPRPALRDTTFSIFRLATVLLEIGV